jgi:hypothetical protein
MEGVIDGESRYAEPTAILDPKADDLPRIKPSTTQNGKSRRGLR